MWLSTCYAEALASVFCLHHGLQAALDPLNILNPGKIGSASPK